MKTKKEMFEFIKNDLLKDDENKNCYFSLINQIEESLETNVKNAFVLFRSHLNYKSNLIDEKTLK